MGFLVKFGLNLATSVRFVLSARLSENEVDSEREGGSEGKIVSGGVLVAGS